jgi:hypothetical protein
VLPCSHVILSPSLLALLEAAPTLRAHGAHVLIRKAPAVNGVSLEGAAAAVPNVRRELKAVMAHPRASVATLRVQLPAHVYHQLTNSSLLAASLADKVWNQMSAEEKAPW